MVDREIASVPAPPFSDELLADLHAGNLDPDLASRLWPIVQADPAAREVIESLDAVVSLLAARGRDLDASAETPEWVRTRLDDAVAGPAPTTRWFSSRPALIGLAAAAAVLVVAAVVGVGMLEPTSETPSVQADGSSAGIRGDMVAGTLGRFDGGRLGDADVLRECLAANGIDPNTTVLGTSPVTIDGRSATLVILPGPAAPTLTALAVGDACGAGSPDTVSRTDIG